MPDPTAPDAAFAIAPDQALLVFPEPDRQPDLLRDELDHRAIGVVYHPGRERRGNYVPTRLGDRYDAFCWFDRTRALTPLPTRAVDVLEPETYPTGV